LIDIICILTIFELRALVYLIFFNLFGGNIKSILQVTRNGVTNRLMPAEDVPVMSLEGCSLKFKRQQAPGMKGHAKSYSTPGRL
jgi:hypothetical protein